MLLHYGSADAPSLVLIDGGASGTFKKVLGPRLAELRGPSPEAKPLRLRLAVVSHLDDDHINGLLGLLDDQVRRVEDHGARTVVVDRLWLNAFKDLTHTVPPTGLTSAVSAAGARLADPRARYGPESSAIVASIGQAERLHGLGTRLSIPLNRPFEGLVMARSTPIAFGELSIQVIGPDQERLDDLQVAWQEYLAKRAERDEEAIAKAVAYVDRSVYNLSSIVFVATSGERSMLLTGDARGDHILAWLEAAGLLKNGCVHVDLLKVPHHGSDRTVEGDFFRRVTADQYVISADGTHGNPDAAVLAMLRAARPRADYQIHFTYRLPAIEAFVKQAHDAGERFGVSYRSEEALSVVAHLS